MEDFMNRSILSPLLAVVVFGSLTSGCGDVTGATGELGRINYWLYTDYVIDDWSLTETSILTGHQQRINTDLTARGEQDAHDREITHTVTPSTGVTIEHDSTDEDVSDLVITVDAPGIYTVESVINGNVFDTIDLEFDAPTELDQITFARSPGGEDFEELSSTSPTVQEGTQAVFLPIPYDAAGDRIAGDISVKLTADPEDMIVEGSNVLGVYEQGVLWSSSPSTIYFVDSGEVTISLTDVPNGVSAVTTFTVEDL
jgi:hypothetical protein